MNVRNTKAPFILFLGDMVFFVVSLALTLLIRYGNGFSEKIFFDHVTPFAFLFIVWIFVYFIAGLYDQYTIVLQKSQSRIILNAQIANSVIAITFFYLIPYFGITPKTNLFIYLVVSWALITLWRTYGLTAFGSGTKQRAMLISSGEEMRELKEEVNANPHYKISFVSHVDLDTIDSPHFHSELLKEIEEKNISIVAVDFHNKKVEPLLASMYNLIFSNIAFVDIYKIYEDIFGRVPLSLVQHAWFLENVSLSPKITYDALKRVMDLVVAFFLGVVSLVFYPCIWLLIKLDDGGPVFIAQKRVGRNGLPITIYKFRTMARNEIDLKQGGNAVTRIGNFLRMSRLDELPQLWNVFFGDMSLIGPRPELPSGVKLYEEEIPYYGIRHIIKPGLSGWAQLYHDNHPHHGVAVDATREKLSYDLYYLENRSFILDIKIALKTIKKMLSRSGL